MKPHYLYGQITEKVKTNVNHYVNNFNTAYHFSRNKVKYNMRQ